MREPACSELGITLGQRVVIVRSTHGPARRDLDVLSVLAPVLIGITKRFCRHISQEVCPWNVKFSQELAAGSPFAAREFIRGEDAVTLARELLAMSQEEFSAVLKNSPMKRAKLRGLQRNAAVVLENVDNSDDADVLSHALDDAEPLAQEHAAYALAPLEARLAPREH